MKAPPAAMTSRIMAMDFAPPAMEPATSLIGRPLEGPKTHTDTRRAMSRAMATRL